MGKRMSESVGHGIVLLALVSFIVRIVPAIVRLDLKEGWGVLVHESMPVAVLVTLAVYVFLSQSSKDIPSSVVGFALLTILVIRGTPTSVAVIVSSLVYWYLTSFARYF